MPSPSQNSYYVFSLQQMINIANGGNGASGPPIQGIAGFGVGAGTSSATVLGEPAAIDYLTNVLGLNFDKTIGWGPMKEFYFSTTAI